MRLENMEDYTLRISKKHRIGNYFTRGCVLIKLQTPTSVQLALKWE